MESPMHPFNSLFDQLRLPSEVRDIENFIEQHKPVSAKKAIYELGCFTPSQQSFLREAIEQDADRTEITDTLDALIRQPADIRPS
jgi:hypothetical protein